MRFVPYFPDSGFSVSRRAAGPLLGVLIMFYLGFHAVSGERGLVALFKESRRLEQLTAELTTMRDKREGLEKKIRLMSPDALDLDMLDEQARNVLGLAGKDEVVIFTK